VTHQQKVQHLLADLKERGKPARMGAPLLWRLLWWLGFELPPPLFLGYWSLTLILILLLAAGWGVMMWLLQWQFTNMSFAGVIAASAAFGLLTGPLMGWLTKRESKKLQLPSWSAYPAMKDGPANP
jgi:hypothetical protein